MAKNMSASLSLRAVGTVKNRQDSAHPHLCALPTECINEGRDESGEREKLSEKAYMAIINASFSISFPLFFQWSTFEMIDPT